jgi:hypothetical protein
MQSVLAPGDRAWFVDSVVYLHGGRRGGTVFLLDPSTSRWRRASSWWLPDGTMLVGSPAESDREPQLIDWMTLREHGWQIHSIDDEGE